MPELQPYKGLFAEWLASMDTAQAEQVRQPSGITDLAHLAPGGYARRLIIGAVVAWWLLGVGLFVAVWLLGGLSLVMRKGGILGVVGMSYVPCLCFLLLVAGTVAVAFGGPRLQAAIVGRRLGSPVMWASAEELLRGDTLDLTFSQDINRPTDIQSVVFQLLLRETVTYTSGTDRVTVTHDHVIGRVERPGRPMQKGYRLEERADFRIPPDAMHTFVASNNKLQWFVTVQVKIARWPDFRKVYQVTVLPEITP